MIFFLINHVIWNFFGSCFGLPKFKSWFHPWIEVVVTLTYNTYKGMACESDLIMEWIKETPKKKKWCAILMLSISIADSYRLLTASKRNIGSNKTATILSQSMGVKITSNMGFVFTLDYGIWVRFLCLETMMWATYPCPLTTTIHTNSTTTWMIWYT